MIDHVRTLLLNPSDVPGYRRVTDDPADAVLARFGLSGNASTDVVHVARLLPLALAPDLAAFRTTFDPRTTPPAPTSVYATADAALDPGGLYDAVLGDSVRVGLSALFTTTDDGARPTLDGLWAAARCRDAPYALGAVLLACAYRRQLLQGGEA